MFSMIFFTAAFFSARTHAASCPEVWSTVATQLKNTFGDCNSNARQAIRLPFHDCWPGACDGSIILSDECTSRSENTQLVPICQTLGSMAMQYNVGVADLIQVSAGIAVAACPPSTTITIKVGRQDSSQANPANQIPSPDQTADELVSIFQSKGFSIQDLVSLVGSHSAGVNASGIPLDTTDNELDSPTFYGETLNGTAPTSLFSDQSLATSDSTRGNWQRYINSQSSWNTDFAAGMEKLALMGVQNQGDLVDCTSAVFGAEGSFRKG